MVDTPDPSSILRFAQAGTTICVRVDEAKGSTPRIAGTQMLVSRQGVLGTIGGGQLEYLAIDAARAMLSAVDMSGTITDRRLAVPLGPDIGQCCGGHVILYLSALTVADAQALADQVRADQERQPHIYIFGAGHVGRALATALLPLPVNPLLVDTRREELALADPAVPQDLTPLPEAHIRTAPTGSAFVVLTHDHALDFLIAREALTRAERQNDVAYVGMIGSKTKRATFARWLETETGTRTGLDRLIMPIGAARSPDKRPAVIAVHVAAEVMDALSVWHPSSDIAVSRSTKVLPT